MGGCASKPKVLKAEKLEAAMPLMEEKTVEVAGGDQKVLEEVTKAEVGKEAGGGDHEKEKASEEKVVVVEEEEEAGEENKPRSLGNLLKEMVTLHRPMKSFI